MNQVVVTGMGAVSCLGNDVPALWGGLIAGRCGIAPLTRIKADDYRNKLAGQVSGLDQPAGDDPTVRFLLKAAAEALEQGGIDDAARGKVSLVLGTNFGAMAATEELLAGYRLSPEQCGTAAPGCDSPLESRATHVLALAEGVTRAVAGRLRLGGAQMTLSLSCASGNAAIGRAADLIRSGRAQMALAGGYDAISDVVWAGLCSLRAMSATAARPFDKRRDGTIFSEGAGLMLLEDREHALARGALPLARFLGYGTSSNAFHMTHPDEDGAGMARAMRDALQDAGIAAEAVEHINAHATGTPPNDRLETMAIKSVFGDRARRIPIVGIKGMLGHAMGAASALEAIATVMTIREGIIPPTIGLEEPDPECDLDYVPGSARKAKVGVALNNSAGFGGCNASVLFARWEI